MTSAQERLQVNRLPLDKWTIRERLCLASAVSCSGDQNCWMSVSRTLKLVCGGNANRPSDWFSQKSCAVQYGNLLENVETPKRKKRTSESNTGVSSPATVETPTDIILRRLAEERVQELKANIRKEQEEYAKICRELKTMESDQLEEGQLLDMWRDIEKQQETQRIEEMKLENQMREREQRKQDMQRTWRSALGPTSTVAAAQQKPATDITTVDMDVEEITGNGKLVLSNAGTIPYTQQQQKTGTSPLLSSLLKSPTSSTVPTGVPAVLSPVSVAGSARATAPTITTLLTSGSIPNPNQPAITLKNNILPPNEAAELLARPISGPPTDTASTISATTQTLISPSQSAPTLSMLLEKNKTAHTAYSGSKECTTTNTEVKPNEVIVSRKTDIDHAVDSNNEEVPMDIEEDVGVAIVSSNVDLAGVDSDEPDPNEEQQLLEVFKNIGNIDELDIDVAAVIDDGGVDFLKGVDEEPGNDATDVMDFKEKTEHEGTASSLDSAEVKNNLKKETQKSGSVEVKSETKRSEEITIREGGTENMQTCEEKVETISSDDSNDNIPLAAVASLESKERSQISDGSAQEKDFLKEKVESAIKNEDSNASMSNEAIVAAECDVHGEEMSGEERDDEGNINATFKSAAEIAILENTQFVGEEQKSPLDSENSDVIVIPTDDDESNGEKPKALLEKKLEKENLEMIVKQKDQEAEPEDTIEKKTKSELADNSSLEERCVSHQETPTAEYDSTNHPAAIISIDTDDSSTTDISVSMRKEDKMPNKASSQQRKNTPDMTRRSEQKSDEDSTIAVSASTATAPARPPLLRKLRDRDRSESPLIDDEVTTTSDNSTTHQRSRRRCSSTPLLDSIPNSPASSDRDERETRASKKSLLSIFNALHPNKNAVVLQRAFSDDHTPNYSEVCLRPMDWQAIKKNIESGGIRSVNELQRDIMLMSHNAMMVFHTSSADYKAAIAFLQECQNIREFTSSESVMKVEKEVKEIKSGSATAALNSSGVRARTGSRKSQRIS